MEEWIFGGDLTHHGYHGTGALVDMYLDFNRSSLTTLFTSTKLDAQRIRRSFKRNPARFPLRPSAYRPQHGDDAKEDSLVGFLKRLENALVKMMDELPNGRSHRS